MDRQDDIERLLGELFVPGEGAEYVEFSNSVGQRYFIPARHAYTGLQLYHASRLKGKLVKLLLPLVRRWSPLLTRIGARKTMLRESLLLHELLAQVFGSDELALAVSCGTPGPHRKITIQISRGNKVLGYAKVSDRAEVKTLFEREGELLNRLHALGVDSVPQSIFFGDLLPGTAIFIQDTTSKERAFDLRKDERLICDFLTKLSATTSVDVPFEESGYYADLQRLKANISRYEVPEAALLERTIAEIESFSHNSTTRFSTYHGDLTPWNMYIQSGKLFVFDWEYSRPDYPPMLDYFHLFTQYAFFERRWDAAQTMREFSARQGAIKQCVPHPTRWYKAYLLAIIGFYMERERGKTDEGYRFRIGLLTLLAGMAEKEESL